ncbi:hypothetical protein MMC10_010441 [Thelotrema lepadinum]|nr:hypothetical protein [Thelotrema lepadinum]
MSSSSHLPVHSSGIYRNLPTFDDSLTGLNAIVTGATGISGWSTIRSLLDTSDRWSKIYALSRKPPSDQMLAVLKPDQIARIQHVPIDLLESPETVADALKCIKDANAYVFFYAYLQPKVKQGEPVWSNADELLDVNSRILSNFLQALPLAQLKPKRILLQTGGKHYGVHLGRTRLPCVESDPRPLHSGPNFYYPQEDHLFEYCKKNPDTSWNVIRPFAIFGAAVGAQMNMLYLLAIYAAVQAHKRQPLYFSGNWTAWQSCHPASTGRLTGYLSEWAILENKCANQAFNSEDGNGLTLDRFFHELARWYGAEKGVVGPVEEEDKYAKFEVRGGPDCPLGYGPPLTSGTSFRFADWAKEPENKQAWNDIVETNNKVIYNPFEDENVEEIFSLADFMMMAFPTVSMNKARIFGWTGFVDTLEGACEAISDMATMGMLSPLQVASAHPMI